VLAALLIFIPYIGTLAGAAMPILLSLAVFDGWMKPLLAFGAFVSIEIITSYVVEPLLYAAHTGFSSLAILVAAIFWAALWGPVGLLLSTPLTVCIVVIGRYIPQWEFLSVLLGDQRVLGTEVQLYQKLRRMNAEEARQVVDERALSCSGRAGQTDDPSSSAVGKESFQKIRPSGRAILDHGNRARQGPYITRAQRLDPILHVVIQSSRVQANSVKQEWSLRNHRPVAIST